MLDNNIGDLTLQQLFFGIIIVLVFFVTAWLARFLLVKYIRKMTAKTKTKLDDHLLKVLQNPVVFVISLLGFYIAFLSFPQSSTLWSSLAKGVATVLSLLGIYIVILFTDTLLKWYRRAVLRKQKDVGFSLKLLTICWLIIILAGVWVAIIAGLGIWGQEVGKVTNWFGTHGWRIALIIGLAMVIIVAVGELLPRIVVKMVSRRPDEKDSEVNKRSDTLSRVLVSTSQIFIILIAIFMILSELKIDIGPILASAGVVGIAVGFGAQSLVKDVVAGLFVIIESQYRVGDVVRVADVAGVVESINLRRTVLRDLDGIVHTVPNGEIRVASNFTKEVSKVNLNISVGYGEDLDRVIAVINKLGAEMAEDPAWKSIILQAPHVLRVDNFGDSGIEIKIVGDTQPIKQWDVTGELRLRLKKTFDKENIEIPWPHTKVYFGNTPPGPAKA